MRVGNAQSSCLLLLEGASVQTHGGPLLGAYHGTSMHPTLSDNDLLEIEAYADTPIAAGDVIWFTPASTAFPVVHRVRRITSEGLVTHGDNNPMDDPWAVQPDEVVGKVVRARRGSHLRTIRGGRLGLLEARATHGLHALLVSTAHLGKPLLELKMLRRLRVAVTMLLNPRVVSFCECEKGVYLLARGRWILGKYDRQCRLWRLSPLAKLLVTEDILSGNPS